MKKKVFELLRMFVLVALAPVLSTSLVSCNPENGEEEMSYLAVDLGLSVKWAACNVGAEIPEGLGAYYAWGELAEKYNYVWTEYKWSKTDGDNYKIVTKYCTNSKYGDVDNKSVLEAEDDVARVKWGGNWRLPTKEEFKELRDKCTSEWVSVNGVNGYKFTGPNGNSIFLPASGRRSYEYQIDDEGVEGHYWSSTISETDCFMAFSLAFSEKERPRQIKTSRWVGLSVRSVIEYEVE